jgi:hypothetical protein
MADRLRIATGTRGAVNLQRFVRDPELLCEDGAQG